jgi:hypothetical protein
LARCVRMNDKHMSNCIIKEFSGEQYLNVQLTRILGNIFGEVEYVGWKAHERCNLSPMDMLCTSTSVVSTTQLYSPNKVKQKKTMCTCIKISLPMEHNENQKLCQPCQPSLLMQFELDVHVVYYYINSEHHPTLFN